MASEKIMAMLDEVAKAHGIEPGMFRAFAGIESTFRPGAVKGSYKGLFMLSEDDFKEYGSKGGNILNARDNAEAAARSLNARTRSFRRRVGRNPTPSELYLSHQQGKAGLAAHAKNPKGVAWKNIRPYYTDAAARKKGFKNGDEYAKAAIWGNLPPTAREQFGSVDNVTSGDFTQVWDGRVSRGLRTHGYNPTAEVHDPAGFKKSKDRLPQELDFTPKGMVQGIKRNVREAFQGAKPLSPELNDRAFGKPFGELFQNQLDISKRPDPVTTATKSVPGKVPLFREILSGLFGK